MSAEDYKKISFSFRPDIIFIDCACRTDTSTSTAAIAAIANYICHDKIPPLFISFIL